MTVATVIFMAITLAGALLAVSLKNLLHAIFGLALSLFGIAGLFVLLGSPFVAVMQVLIYIGGITIAMIFAIMLSTVVGKQKPEPTGRRVLAASGALAFFAGTSVIITKTDFAPLVSGSAAGTSSVQALGVSLLNEYNVAFESLSVVLLLAIVGAIVIARQPKTSEPEGAPDQEEPS